jgi:hypothetical protein
VTVDGTPSLSRHRQPPPTCQELQIIVPDGGQPFRADGFLLRLRQRPSEEGRGRLVEPVVTLPSDDAAQKLGRVIVLSTALADSWVT